MKRITRLAVPLAALAVLAGCGDSPETLLAKAQESYAAENYQAARLQLASALREEPENQKVLALMARTQLRLGEPDGAEGILTRLERIGYKSADLSWMKAQVALLRENPEQALQLVGNDTSTNGWRVRAEAHLALGHDTKAVDAYKNGMAAEDDIQHAEYYARYRLVSGEPDGAGSNLQRMEKMAPDAYETKALAGDLAAARGQTDKAIAIYKKLVADFPGRTGPLLALANQYDAKGKVDEASDLVKEAGKLDPDNEQVEALTYQLLAEKGEWDKVRLGLQGKESQLDPGSGLQMRYAEAMLRLGHAEQARVMFNRAVLALPGNPYAKMMLGEAQLASGDAESAWATLKPLAMSTLAPPPIIESGAKAAKAVGAPEAASLEARMEPSRLKPTMALVEKGNLAVMHQDWPQVLRVFSKLLEKGEDPEVLKRLALATSNLGRPQEAIGYADRALAKSPTNPDYLYLAGLVRLNAGLDLVRARNLLQSAASADPRNTVIARDLKKAEATVG